MRSIVASGVINGGATQIVSPIAGSAPPARMRGKRPRAIASRVIRPPSPTAGALVPRSATNSTPPIMPIPRTSPTAGR